MHNIHFQSAIIIFTPVITPQNLNVQDVLLNFHGILNVLRWERLLDIQSLTGYTVQVSQIPCSVVWKAPEGCTQWFTGTSG